MKSEMLIAQIEKYSNAIVAFAVLQGLAYSYAFGTNVFFNCLIKTAPYLAEGLTLLFALATPLLVVATVALGRVIEQIAGDFRDIVRKIYIGKLIAVVIFSLVPMLLTIGYGVRDYPGKAACQAVPVSKQANS